MKHQKGWERNLKTPWFILDACIKEYQFRFQKVGTYKVESYDR